MAVSRIGMPGPDHAQLKQQPLVHLQDQKRLTQPHSRQLKLLELGEHEAECPSTYRCCTEVCSAGGVPESLPWLHWGVIAAFGMRS